MHVYELLQTLMGLSVRPCMLPAALKLWGAPCRYVKRAMHGTRIMSWGEVRQVYGRELINLRHESRFVFLNTLFSVSEGVMYMQVHLINPHYTAAQTMFILCKNSFAKNMPSRFN